MKFSLFIKSYEHDFPWLEYTRESIRKFASTAFDEIVLVLPRGEWFDWPEAKVHWIEEEKPGYHFQMSVKCMADKFCMGDVIVFGDSDACFKRPVSLQDFIKDGKPIWLFKKFDEARQDQQNVWREPMHKFVGKRPTVETMRRHCHQWPREFFPKLREFCLQRHRQTLHEYIMAQAHPDREISLTFSEFNCAGWFAHQFCPELFSWVDEKDRTPDYTAQGFTHGGEERKRQDFAEYERILSAIADPEEARKCVHEVIRAENQENAPVSHRIKKLVHDICEIIKENKPSRLPVLHAELRKAELIGPAKPRGKRK